MKNTNNANVDVEEIYNENEDNIVVYDLNSHSEDESEGNKAIGYVAVAALAVGAFALAQRGAKAIVKRVKAKMAKSESENTESKNTESKNVVVVEESDVKVVEEPVEEPETSTKKK